MDRLAWLTEIESEQVISLRYDNLLKSIPIENRLNYLESVSNLLSVMDANIVQLGIIHKRYIDSILEKEELPLGTTVEQFKQCVSYEELKVIEQKALAMEVKLAKLEEKLSSIWTKESWKHKGLLNIFPPVRTIGFLRQLIFLAQEGKGKGLELPKIMEELIDTIEARSLSLSNRKRKENYLFIVDIKEVIMKIRSCEGKQVCFHLSIQS